MLILTESRPSRWVSRLIADLRQRGVPFAPAGDPGNLRLDLRPAPVREPAAPEGIERWCFIIGDERGGVPAFGEALRGEESVEVRLLAQRGAELRELRYGRFPYASRYARTMDRIAEQCSLWIEQELRTPLPFSQLPVSAPTRKPAARIHPLERLGFLAREARRFWHHALRYLFEQVRWDVAVTKSSIEAFLSEPNDAWLHWVGRTDREFLADPFLTRSDDGSPRLLCETLDGTLPRIVAIDLDDRFAERQPLTLGEGPASYPYVFEVDGELWLTPEQHRRTRLDAYRLQGANTCAATLLLDGVAVVDPTIVRHDGLWWLFYTDQRSGPNYALHVCWAEHPRGPWRPHARNPVKIDIAGARPAGNFFMRDGLLHRPAQDCTERYGHAITIQRIDVLTPEAFAETCVARIDASVARRKGAIGVHTLSHGHGWVALDAQFARWSLSKPLQILRGHLA